MAKLRQRHHPWGLPLAELLLVAAVVLTIGFGIGAFAMTAPTGMPMNLEWWDATGSLEFDDPASTELNEDQRLFIRSN